jgi:hypothetical protein
MNAGHSKVRLSMAGDVAGYGQAFTDTIRGQRWTGPP